jgi:hypothetical protein
MNPASKSTGVCGHAELEKELYRVAIARPTPISPRNTYSAFSILHLSREGARTAEGR